jgi:hypothetical protein
MLGAGVLVHRVCKPLSVLSFRVIVVSAVRCVFIFFEGSGDFLKTIFLALALQAL